MRGIVLESPFGAGLFNLIEKGIFELFFPLFFQLPSFFKKHKKASKSNNNEKIHIVTHSYGCLVVAYWMEHYRPSGMNESEWKDWISSKILLFCCLNFFI